MKKKITISVAAICLLFNAVTTAQVTTPSNNTIFPLQYVGWSGLGAISKPLDIRNRWLNQPINFFTNAGALHTRKMLITQNAANEARVGIGAAGNAEIRHQENLDMNFFTGDVSTALNAIRMIILGIAGPTQGFVGIGTNFLTPLSLLHINAIANNTGEVFRTEGPDNVTNGWRLFTGPTAATTTEKFAVLTGTGTGLINNLNNVTLQATQRDLIFNASTTTFERARIVGINRTLFAANAATTYPVRAGNVGIGTNSPTAMLQIGGNVTNFGGYRDWMDVGTYYQQGSDNMYVGFRTTTTTSSDALINWGNNPTPTGVDRLLFNFTALTSGTFQASGVNGLEAARFVTNGNRFFIGFGGDPLNPNQNAYTANPDPGNTVEINSSATSVIPGSSGLRFTDLNSTSTPVSPPPTTNVLSVDANGDIILVPGNEEKIPALESRIKTLEEKINELYAPAQIK